MAMNNYLSIITLKVNGLNAPSQKRMAKNIPSNENQRPATKATLPSKVLNQDRRPNKEFPRSLKEYASTKPALQEMLKGLL